MEDNKGMSKPEEDLHKKRGCDGEFPRDPPRELEDRQKGSCSRVAVRQR